MGYNERNTLIILLIYFLGLRMRESAYQRDLIKRIKEQYPGVFILKNDSGSVQGIPDLLVLHRKHWAMLEVKESANSEEQPNQDHYIRLFDSMSFGRFIYPENEHEVLDDLQLAFRIGRPARFLKPE